MPSPRNLLLPSDLWPRCGKCLRITAALIGFLLVAEGAAHAASPDPTDVKIVTMLRIIEGTEWPEGSFFNPEDPLVIGVLGTDPYGPRLDELAVRAGYRSRPIEVRRYPTPKDLMPCHVLLVGKLEGQPLETSLELVSGLATLTFGEATDFVPRGGMVSVRIEHRRMHYELNRGVAEREGLAFSEKVLTVASRVSR